METEILKMILHNQGSMDTEELVYNLGGSSEVMEIIVQNEQFVSCLVNQRPKVVVRSRMGLCWTRDCPGCGRLHLCLGFLFSGYCQFNQLRRGCSFSHELHSEYNMEVLREFGLEALSRTELCLLLLQSHYALLPQICHKYNSRAGCQDDCQRLHVCQRYLPIDCICPRTHDFTAPQPLKLLQEKHIPDHLMKVLKSVYANKEALRLADKENRSNSSNSNNENELNNDTSSEHFTGYDSDSSSISAKETSGRGWRGGRGGRRGRRRGQNRAPSRGDSEDSTTADLTNDSTENYSSSHDQDATNETPRDDYDSDTSSTVSTGNGKEHRGGYARGRGSYRGQWSNRRGRGGKQPASDFDGSTNASEGSRRGSNGNYRGSCRGGRGNRGFRGGRSDKVERIPSENDLKTKEDHMGVNRSQDSTPISETLSGFETGLDSGKKQDSSIGAEGKNSSASNVKTTDASSNNGPPRRQTDKTEICMFFIKGHCKHEERCFKAHDKMPYRWEIRQGGQWTPMAENETIEKDYCDPEKVYSSTSPAVHFDTMTCGSDEVRRLSTVNSVQQPGFIHTTDWLWYWEDEYGTWYQYAAVTSEHRLASITSKELEEMYQTNNKDVVTFTAGSEAYDLSFQDMIQTNLRYSTKRLVRRRPRFVSAAEVQTKRKCPPRSTAVPDYWDKTQIPQIGFKRVPLQPSSGEYKEIQALFNQTMASFEILKIERIQNRAVWEAFQLHKTHMKQKNGGQLVLEKKLFHGTEPKFVDTICATNFDWRVCGVNGTVYGQGSYFARDAKYSHDYTGDSDPRFMFVSRVLVGEFTKGSSEYRRPPSKDGGDVNLFDSCVNNISNPSIFVVFKEQQIYPEYLLQYKHIHTNVYAQRSTSSFYGQSTSNAYTQSSRQTAYPGYNNVPPPSSYTSSHPTPKPTPAPTSNDNQNSCVIA